MSLISEALSRWLPMRGPALSGRLDELSSRPTRSGEPGPSVAHRAASSGRSNILAPSGRLDEGESEGAIKNSSPGMTSCKGTSTGPLIAYHNLGEPVWAPRDYAAFAREGFMQNAIVYPQAVAEARRLTGASNRVAEADLPIVLDDGLAGSIVESWLYETWATRESATFKLPPSALALEPGDIVSANIGGRSRLLRLTNVAERGIRDIQALSIDPTVYDQIDVSSRTATPPPKVQVGSPAVALMDLPQWNATFDASSGYAAAMQKPWPGSVALFVSPQETGYQLKAVASAAATVGLILDDVPPGPEGCLDHRASFRVRLTNGALASVDLVSMLAGANLAALRNANGDWEVIQFQNADLVDTQTYRLSGLLRGQFGTESAMSAMLSSGAQFVLLDAAVTRVPVLESERKLMLNWRYGPGNRDIGDASYITVPFAYQSLGLRPLSPVHVKARGKRELRSRHPRRRKRETHADVIPPDPRQDNVAQRSRWTGGDNWELPDVPLGAPVVVYTSADQITDFGSVQSSVSVKVYQTNVLFGRGSPRAAVV